MSDLKKDFLSALSKEEQKMVAALIEKLEEELEAWPRRPNGWFDEEAEQRLQDAIDNRQEKELKKELEKELNRVADMFAKAHRSILRLSICISVIGIGVAILALKDVLS